MPQGARPPVANRCPACHAVVARRDTGRPPTYCSDACRNRAWRHRRADTHREQLVTLVQADARLWLSTLPTASVDLVLTDPPYQFNRGTTYFRTWFDDLPDSAWPEIFAELHRVLRPHRHCLVCCDEPTMPVFDHPARLAGFRRNRPLIWDKDWIGLGSGAYRASWEYVCYYDTGPRPGTANNVRDVLTHRRPARGYPTQKPLSLYQDLIAQSSRPGELVLDPFCGSGTTGLAARTLNRRALLCDIDTATAATRLGVP